MSASSNSERRPRPEHASQRVANPPMKIYVAGLPNDGSIAPAEISAYVNEGVDIDVKTAYFKGSKLCLEFVGDGDGADGEESLTAEAKANRVRAFLHGSSYLAGDGAVIDNLIVEVPSVINTTDLGCSVLVKIGLSAKDLKSKSFEATESQVANLVKEKLAGEPLTMLPPLDGKKPGDEDAAEKPAAKLTPGLHRVAFRSRQVAERACVALRNAKTSEGSPIQVQL